VTELLKQADDRWRKRVLGNGPASIGLKGCVLLSVINAARELGTRISLTPLEANASCVVGQAFDGQALNVERAARLFGLSAPYTGRTVIGAGELPRALSVALGSGMALVRVDYVGRGEPTDDGRHTILARAFGVGGQQVECWDPAAGRVLLSFPGLSAKVRWGDKDERTYRVVKVHPIRVLSS
jgi:hypothetical protein